MSAAGRYVVVTPYYKEERPILERCMDSVRRQSVRTDHLLVADGFPQDWIDTVGVRHLRLEKAHGDYGNTPRGVGGVLAAAEGYDAIVLLDADNWLEPDHVESCLAAAQSTANCDYVIARRNLMRPDQTRIGIADEPIDRHVDTNCYFFLPGSYHTLHFWAIMPREVSSLGDRVFFSALRARRLVAAVVDTPTVNYNAMWQVYYTAVGEVPPLGAKPSIDPRPALEWLERLSIRQYSIASRLAGVPLVRGAK